MVAQIELGDTTVDVVQKNIKNVHLSVYPPTGRVRISAPSYMNMESIRLFAISKLDWIRKQQDKLQAQEREAPRDFIERESHYVWGQRYLLKVIEADHASSVELKANQMVLYVGQHTDREKRQLVIEAWYRDLLKSEIPKLITKWEPLMGVSVDRFYVQRMKTRWGSCNPERRSIRLNTDLARKPRECLEYIVVHEMAHIIEPTHNARFVALMDQFMPGWAHRKGQLNQLPVRHEEWGY